MDFNYRSALWDAATAGKEPRALTALVDVVFATVAEARLEADGTDPVDLAKALGALGPGHAIIKRGEQGAVAYCDGRAYERAALPVSVVDPVGAGDAFAAAHLAELGLGPTVQDCLATGVTAGAFVVTVPSDWEGMPSRAELDLWGAGEDPVLR